MKFRFLATDSNGCSVGGEIAADSSAVAMETLESGGLLVTLLQVCGESSANGQLGGLSARSGRRFPAESPARQATILAALRYSFSSLKRLFQRMGALSSGLKTLFCDRRPLPFFGRRRIKKNWKFEFFDQLAMLLTAGLPIEHCLAIISDESKSTGLAGSTIRELMGKISSGMALSEGMACCGVFSQAEVRAIRAAEKIGRPAAALAELAAMGKKLSAIGGKVKSAMIYPAVVLAVTCLVMLLLTTVVIPKFESVFASQGSSQQMPLLTTAVISCCNFFGNHFTALVIFAFGVSVALKIALKKQSFKDRALSMCAKLPVIGPLLIELNLHAFFRTISMLMAFGVPVQDALDLAICVVSECKLKKSLRKSVLRMRQGESLASSFRSNKFLTATSLGLVAAGERSGNLADSLAKTAEIYDRRIEARTSVLTTLLEPAITIILALIVGTVVIAMFLPLVAVMKNISLR
jgi:type IV pilus assembly protein PilC